MQFHLFWLQDGTTFKHRWLQGFHSQPVLCQCCSSWPNTHKGSPASPWGVPAPQSHTGEKSWAKAAIIISRVQYKNLFIIIFSFLNRLSFLTLKHWSNNISSLGKNSYLEVKDIKKGVKSKGRLPPDLSYLEKNLGCDFFTEILYFYMPVLTRIHVDLHSTVP